MGKIDIFRNGSVTFRNVPPPVTMCNASVTLRYSLHVAHAVGECILRRGGSDALFQ